jgi:hypothetical protein
MISDMPDLAVMGDCSPRIQIWLGIGPDGDALICHFYFLLHIAGGSRTDKPITSGYSLLDLNGVMMLD